MNCNCKDWLENIAKVNAPLMLQAARSGFHPSANYNGVRFRFCPWCASRLIEEGAPSDPNATDNQPVPPGIPKPASMTEPITSTPPGKPESLEEVARRVVSSFGGLNILINPGQFETMTERILTALESVRSEAYGRGVTAGKLEALQYTPEERERYGRWISDNSLESVKRERQEGLRNVRRILEHIKNGRWSDAQAKCIKGMAIIDTLIALRFLENPEPSERKDAEVPEMALRGAAEDALLVLGVLKVTDQDAPYREISPLLRTRLYAAHDALLKALQDAREASDTVGHGTPRQLPEKGGDAPCPEIISKRGCSAGRSVQSTSPSAETPATARPAEATGQMERALEALKYGGINLLRLARDERSKLHPASGSHDFWLYLEEKITKALNAPSPNPKAPSVGEQEQKDLGIKEALEPNMRGSQITHVLEAIDLAQRAIDGAEWDVQFCECDLDTGAAPCRYCAIQGALRLAKKCLSENAAKSSDAPSVSKETDSSSPSVPEVTKLQEDEGIKEAVYRATRVLQMALAEIFMHAESALTCDLPATETMDIEGAFEQLRDIADKALKTVKEASDDSTRLAPQMARQGELDKELRRWQEEIRDYVIQQSGAPDSKIDGAGCESGDLLDFTLTEIGQGLTFLNDQLCDARMDFTKARLLLGEIREAVECERGRCLACDTIALKLDETPSVLLSPSGDSASGSPKSPSPESVPSPASSVAVEKKEFGE